MNDIYRERIWGQLFEQRLLLKTVPEKLPAGMTRIGAFDDRV
jgi:hypothetical protein